MKFPWRYKLVHAVFWLIVAGIWFYLRYQDYPSLQQAAWITAIKVADLALLIYLANLVLVPRLLYRKKYSLFIISFITITAIASFLKMLMMSLVEGGSLVISKEAVYNNFVTQFFLVLASIAIKSVVDFLQLQKKLADVAKEKAEAELNFLKSQINPHFLFNSLNSVYFLIDKSNTAARDALHRFSEMLRYQLYECNGESLPVEKEITFLNDYVSLQKLRMNEHTSVQFNCPEEISNFSIEPLLLIPFVENSFKHLSQYTDGTRNEIKINIERNNGSMQFSVHNTTEGKTSPHNSGGIGLNNVKKRLELLYPGKHELKINEAQGWYNVELKLSLA